MKWYHNTFNQNELKKSTSVKKTKYTNYDSKVADKNVKYCTKCKNCWEYKYQSSKKYVEFYQDFVTYGKEREVCPNCIEKAKRKRWWDKQRKWEKEYERRKQLQKDLEEKLWGK